MKLFFFFTFFISIETLAATFPTRMKCVSVMNAEIAIKEVSINEYAMAQISYQKDNEWYLEADVVESKLNSIKLTHKPTGAVAEAHSLDYPLNHLFVSLEVQNKKATVDCDLLY
jgi:hypothetical protein